MLKQSSRPGLSGAALAMVLALCVGPQAVAQTTFQTAPPAPVATPDTATPTAPLPNPLNRNPARRASEPEGPPPPPDPRDSTIRPVTPPGSDGRDTVVPTPGATQPRGATSTLPAPARP